MEKAAKFSFEDLEPVLEHHRGNAMFAEALQEAGSPEDLVLLLGRYIQFNSVFGGAVANFAGAVAVRHDLFRDPQDPVAALADRSAEIASTIFYAAIDEFGDPTKVHRVTHRTMAQATLRAAAQCLGYSSAALNGMLQPDAAVQESVAGVLRGYGVGRVMDGRQILRAIGFHIGSELLADQEFCILDQFLRTRYAAGPERFNVPEQFRAIGWVGDRLYSLIFEVRDDQEGEFYHLVTLWKSTRQEKELYADNS